MDRESLKGVSTVNTLPLMDKSNDDQIEAFGRAISSKIRLEMCRQIIQKPMTLVEIAKLNNITNSTALFHLKILQEGGIVEGKYLPGKKGKALVYFVKHWGMFLDLANVQDNQIHVHEQSVGVGEYVEADLKLLNIATKEQIVHLEQNRTFASERFNAKLLWTEGGKVSYAFENNFTFDTTVQEITLSLEICSEAHFYRNDWKSDITFAINNVELGTYTSPGDFGGIRGKLNPAWWGDENSQYGILVIISITSEGTFFNSQKVSDITLEHLKLTQDNKILFSIYNKPNCEFFGGFNIFGDCFGNYPQNILLTAKYKPNKEI